MSAHAEIDYRLMLDNTCKAYEAIRTPNGFYLDSFFLDKKYMKGNVRVSSATTGIGLISLCIAEKSGFGQNNAQKSLQTLKLLNGKGSVKLERNKNGLFKHFFNYKNGKSHGSEFSTIDTALLISGALFCKNTFSENKSIAAEVKELWNSINWKSCRITKTTYWLAQDKNGQGVGQTRMFNEYLLLADFCFDKTPLAVSDLKVMYLRQSRRLEKVNRSKRIIILS
jgi:hypothetical protein